MQHSSRPSRKRAKEKQHGVSKVKRKHMKRRGKGGRHETSTFESIEKGDRYSALGGLGEQELFIGEEQNAECKLAGDKKAVDRTTVLGWAK